MSLSSLFISGQWATGENQEAVYTRKTSAPAGEHGTAQGGSGGLAPRVESQHLRVLREALPAKAPDRRLAIDE